MKGANLIGYKINPHLDPVANAVTMAWPMLVKNLNGRILVAMKKSEGKTIKPWMKRPGQ